MEKPQWFLRGRRGPGRIAFSFFCIIFFILFFVFAADVSAQTSCFDECAYAGQQDISGSMVRTCGNYDSDSCLEWGPWEPVSTCYDSCPYQGATQCSGTSGYQVCTLNSNSCLEWSAVQSCGAGICNASTGTCVQPPTVITVPAVVTR